MKTENVDVKNKLYDSERTIRYLEEKALEYKKDLKVHHSRIGSLNAPMTRAGQNPEQLSGFSKRIS